MSADRSARAGRREAVVMGLVFAGLLVLPVAVWGMARGCTSLVTNVLRARRSPVDSCGGIGPCRTYAAAQSLYMRKDWDGDGRLSYAPRLSLLATTLDAEGRPLGLIDAGFAAATSPQRPRHGYIFREMSTIAGEPIDWEKDFALCSTPALYDRTGCRTFIVTTEGTVYGKDLGSSAFVTDYPADPIADGWIIAE